MATAAASAFTGTSGPAPSNKTGGTLEEVMTAQFRKEKLQDTPIADYGVAG
jgi:hypothetical protein